MSHVQQQFESVPFRLFLKTFLDQDTVEQSRQAGGNVDRLIHMSRVFEIGARGLVGGIEQITLDDVFLDIAVDKIPGLKRPADLPGGMSFDQKRIPMFEFDVGCRDPD